MVLEYVPAAQSLHVLMPSDAEYLPLVQSRQTLTPSADEIEMMSFICSCRNKK